MSKLLPIRDGTLTIICMPNLQFNIPYDTSSWGSCLAKCPEPTKITTTADLEVEMCKKICSMDCHNPRNTSLKLHYCICAFIAPDTQTPPVEGPRAEKSFISFTSDFGRYLPS